MDALYVKTAGGLQKVEIAGSGGGSRVSVIRERQVLTSAISAGTAYAVPEHEVGGSDLVVVFNGVLCVEGASEQYTDVNATSIKFNFNLPIGSEIDVIQFDGGLYELSKNLS